VSVSYAVQYETEHGIGAVMHGPEEDLRRMRRWRPPEGFARFHDLSIVEIRASQRRYSRQALYRWDDKAGRWAWCGD
jgi:hypothetical protein